MTTERELRKHLNDFDELFIKCCRNRGMTEEETKRTLLESHERKVITDALVEIASLQTSIIIEIKESK